MDFLPVFLRVKGRTCLLVGAGQVATRKARLLLRAGARLKVVAPVISDGMKELLAKGDHELINDHELIAAPYGSMHLEDVVLVVAATPDNSLNQQIHDAAVARNLPVNVVDMPALCTFIFPSVVDRDPIIVAVSSGGKSPVLARLLRARLETFIPSAYGQLAGLFGSFREQVKARFDTVGKRMRFWEDAAQGPVAELMMSGQEQKARKLLEEKLQNAEDSNDGEVYLVGAGPGDPDLLTFRALRLMQQADVVLYDRLVAPEILNMVRADAERIHVGKARAKHTMPQEEISQLLLRLAQEGNRVLRLKGGDPFIFGRGGEEIELLAEHKIPFQVVPGITAASGCACYSGIPLTHRDYAQSVRFVTGHLKNDTCDLDWDSFTSTTETLVFYMGLVGLPEICKQLILHGRDKETPIALIQQGTTPNQKVLTATLATMPALADSEEIQAPTMIIVGDVVKLHDSLAWRD